MKRNYQDILEEQLARDYDCSIADVQSTANIFRPMRRREDARPNVGEDCKFKLTVYKEKLLVMAEEQILDWCREAFGDSKGTWLSEPMSLISLHQKLQEYGQSLADRSERDAGRAGERYRHLCDFPVKGTIA